MNTRLVTALGILIAALAMASCSSHDRPTIDELHHAFLTQQDDPTDPTTVAATRCMAEHVDTYGDLDDNTLRDIVDHTPGDPINPDDSRRPEIESAFGAAFEYCTQVTVSEALNDASATDTPPPSTTTSTAVAGADTNLSDTVVAYFDDIAGSRFSSHAAPGSLADWYATYIAEVMAESVQAGAQVTVSVSQIGTDEVVITTTYPDGVDVSTFTDIEVTGDGVTTFSVNGIPLADRMTFADATSSDGLVQVDGMMYLTGAGTRNLMLMVTNNSDHDLTVFNNSAFVGPSARQESPVAWAKSDVRPGALGVQFWHFDDTRQDITGSFELDGGFFDVESGGWVSNVRMSVPLTTVGS